MQSSGESGEGELPPGECATVSEIFRRVSALISSPTLKDYIPPSWKHIADVKATHYEGMADFFTAREQLSAIATGARNQETATWTGECGVVI